MYLIKEPNFNNPKITSIIPAINVAITSPSMPYFSMMPYIITTKAPVGPPIWTLLPPKNEIKNPAIMAVISPFSGDTPEAIPKATDNGKAIIATIIPAIKSFINPSLVNPSFLHF